jgi:hypothetical protein
MIWAKMAVRRMKRSELPFDIFDAVTDVLEPFFHVFSASFYAFPQSP